MARRLAITVALVAALLPVSGAGGADAQTPKRGGTIVLLRTANTEPACLNPFACNAAIDPAVMQVLEGAFEVDGDLVERPNLISGFSIGRKPFTITYRIRPEARWSDGVPVTASDFWFTQRLFATLSMPADPGGQARALHRKVRRARVIDDKTFRIELREPFAGWRNLYPIVLPRHALAGKDLTNVWGDRIDNPSTGAAIGSGPFLVGSWTRGRELTLVRNPRYWGPHTAYLDRLVHRFLPITPADALGPVRRNEFDVALALGSGPPMPADVARQVRQTPGWRAPAWPTLAFEHLLFRVRDGGHEALRSKLVRRALAFGIDRVAIARDIQTETGRAVRPLDSAVFYPTEPGYEPNWGGYRYDVGRAQSLLQQAGCRRGVDRVYECDGERLHLRLATTPAPVRARVAELVQAQLRRVGVEIEPVFVPGTIFFSQFLPSGKFDIALFAWIPGPGGVVWPEAQCGHSQNWGGFCDRLLMRDAQQVDLIVDPGQRAKLLNDVDAKIVRAVPALPIVQPVVSAAVRDTVRGLEPGGHQLHFSQNSEDWWLAQSR